MKKSFYLFAALLLTGVFALSLSSCKDNDDTNGGSTPEEMAQSKDSESAKGLLSVLSFTSELDSLPDNWYASNYTVEPTVGTVNDPSTPFVRYVPVQDKEEAIAKYNSIAHQVISEGSTSATFNIENVGSVKFNVLDQTDVIATLDVDIKQQPHLTQVRFVPVSAIGDNASLKGEPYYNFGDVVKVKEGTSNEADAYTYWICVRPCSKTAKKGTSHWMSFNLNDFDAPTKYGVPSSSVNIKQLLKKNYGDYYLPTQLGNESGSREHLQNLFKLLYILNKPSRYANFPKGLGGIDKDELTQEKVEEISRLWEANGVWNTVFPSIWANDNLVSCFNADKPVVNVFYYGYHSSSIWSTVSVHRAQLSGNNLKLTLDKEIEWSRGKEGVDFRCYAKDGKNDLNGGMASIKDLPEYGFIVRYKTGQQLIGGS